MRRWLLVLAPAALLWSAASAAAHSSVERSVVRIENHSQRGDWATPWSASKVVESSGSGFVIEGGAILTNAHVVSDSRLLLVHISDDPEPHQAEVLFMGDDCDLALIRPLDRAALDGLASLRFGGLPALGSLVNTLGYPEGGLRLTSTKGVVSRVEEQVYVHSGADSHLAVQTDAAINPGSSGGPVIQNGRVVGVAFQNNLKLENAGFFIPTEVISRFLSDVKDGKYDGYPELGFETASLEHPAARAYAGMADGESGVRVFRVYRGGSADGRVRVGDIILAMAGLTVANDGSVADGTERIPYGLLIDRMFIGDSVAIRVLRGGQRLDVVVPLTRYPFWDSRRRSYQQKPRYFVYGGLVFVPLCREMLETYGADWRRVAPRTFLDEFVYRSFADPEPKGQERVVLLRRLDDPVNAEMAWYLEQVVERVNGRQIDSLESLVKAFEEQEGAFHLIEFTHARRFGVLDRRMAVEANGRILKRYGIDKDRNL